MSKHKSPRVTQYTFRNEAGEGTPGVGIKCGTSLKVFIRTPAQARKLADQLHDAADELEGKQ